MRLLKTALVCLLMLLAVAAPSQCVDLYKIQAEFLREVLPGEGFVPTPYGADDRFAPKSIWIYIDHLAKKKWGTGTQQAWIAFSDGAAIYPDSLVKLHVRPIDTQSWQIGRDRSFALAAAVTGTLGAQGAKAKLDSLYGREIDFNVSLGEVQVEYGYYYDFLQAQAVNSGTLVVMNALLKKTFPRLPPRRVVIGALRVNGAEVSVTAKGEIKLEANGEVAQNLESLGFKWDQKTNSFKSQKTSGWKYIAFQAIQANETGEISAAGALEGAENYALPAENFDLSLLTLLGTGAPPQAPEQTPGQ